MTLTEVIMSCQLLEATVLTAGQSLNEVEMYVQSRELESPSQGNWRVFLKQSKVALASPIMPTSLSYKE